MAKSRTYENLIAYDVSSTILNNYLSYYYQFKKVTKRAKLRFEERDWHGMQADSKARISLYREGIGKTKNQILGLLDNKKKSIAFWREVKRLYFEDIVNFNTRNIAETFYNSVFRHYHTGLGADQNLMFVNRTGTYREFRSTVPIYHTFYITTPVETTIQQIFYHFKYEIPFEDLARDVDFIVRRMKQFFKKYHFSEIKARIEILNSIFYRGKAGYIVGRMRIDEQFIPFVLPLLHDERGIYVDALLLKSDDISSMFSYHRAYFLVDVDIVSDTVDFLYTILPSKKLSELYNSIGFEKHGKTVFYREFLRHIARTEDQFVEAPGIRGMVMFVFTLPSLNMVFKIIKDKFDQPKKITSEEVKEKYKLVNEHDRVGRMTDTHMFEHLKFSKDRFSPALIEDLQKTCRSNIEIKKDTIEIHHLYVEKRMTPLNLYLETADPKAAKEAINEYGKTIKELAATNIFPGDMLLKNFGVTRLKRIVFYDYDEIAFLTSVNFRIIPEPRDEYEEMSSEPYYHVGINDVFPEEFRSFLVRTGQLKTYFEKVHGNLYTARYWNTIQKKLKKGIMIDVFPYHESQRFKKKFRKSRK